MADPDAVSDRFDLCLGGSFNPVHVGHLAVARHAAEATGHGRVRLVVAGSPPHKPGDPAVIDAAHRVEMCRLAVAGDPLFLVDDREVRRAGPSYTADTAAELAAETGRPPSWLIGADLLAGLPRWHRADELLAVPPRLVRFVVMNRPGHDIDWPALPEIVRHLAANVVNVPQLHVSATHLRGRVAAGRSVRYLVPDPACDYITRHNLYATAAADSARAGMASKSG